MASVKVTSLIPQVIKDIEVKASTLLRVAAEEIERESFPKTPKDKGRLREGVLKQVLGLKGKIIWNKDYAQYQERGSRADGSRKVRNYTTAGTGKDFAKNAVKKIASDTPRIAQKAGIL